MNALFLQVILILTKLYDFHIGSVTESTLWRWVQTKSIFNGCLDATCGISPHLIC